MKNKNTLKTEHLDRNDTYSTILPKLEVRNQWKKQEILNLELKENEKNAHNDKSGFYSASHDIITTIDQLKSLTQILPAESNQLKRIIDRHPMCIPPNYVSLINWNDREDPIRKMAVPSLNELDISGSYDTSGEKENTILPGLQHKYSQTALVLLTSNCFMYCRHCFRKRLVGLPNEEIIKRFSDAQKYISTHPEINNVLISGGDPFTLRTPTIRNVLEGLSKIPSIEFIRFGTRSPVSYPKRITGDDSLVKLFKEYSLPGRRLYVVTQFNHPREINDSSIKAIDRLLSANVIVNNQTVLLRDVNDDPIVLAALQNRLVSIGVNPYYVFQCRPVKRVKNAFQIPLARGVAIIDDARRYMHGHSKRFKYIMAHRTGKIEIVGIMGNEIYFRYHQAKDQNNHGKFFKRMLKPGAGWLDDL